MIPRAFLISLVLPVVFAAIVLGASAMNGRSARGPTVLTERELVLAPRTSDRAIAEASLSWTESGRTIGAWATRDALDGLGFDLSVEPTDSSAPSFYRRQLARRAFVALEMDGPAWQAIRAERERVEARAEGTRLDATRTFSSRLVPIDVNSDAAVLARRYPDPQTHLIVAAVVRVGWFEPFAPFDGPPHVGATIQIDPVRIQVPAAFAATLPQRRPDEESRNSQYTISLVYGARWEPWVVAANAAR